MTRIAIIGAGMAGFGAAHRLYTEGVDSVLYERKSYHGGHTASYKGPSGFIFDDGPHISFTKNERIQRLFAESIHQEYETIQAGVNNYWQGHWIKHPAQCNLYGLPEDLVVKILLEFIEAQNRLPTEIENYRDWLIAAYGKKFAETFPIEYGRKYHTTAAENLTTDWLGPRFYRPDLEEVVRGALSPETPDVHYVSHFRYPTHGGFVSYLSLFLNQTELRPLHELVGVDPTRGLLRFANGGEAPYDHLISSVPLPAVIPMIDGVPDDVVEASQMLACTTCISVNLGINREDLSEAHWTYFYDRGIFFTRLSFPHMLSPNSVPPGGGSIQAEVYYSDKYRPLDREPEECIAPVIRDLQRCGILREDDEILYQRAVRVPYANVIFDHERSPALELVRGYLDQVGIETCGRYGEWGYHWTDEAFLSGENAAQRVLDRMSVAKVA